jgi:3-oxoacyl-[acyl-carrier-protein] synthase II
MYFNKVVITGMGVVTCLGHDVDQMWQSLLNGKSGVKMIKHFDTTDFATRFAGEIHDFDPLQYMDKKFVTRSERYDQYSMAAAIQALKMANLTPENMSIEQKENASVLIGSGMGGMETYYQNCIRFSESGPKKVRPSFIPGSILNMASGKVAMHFGFMGMNYAICSACATSAHAIMSSFDAIRNGRCDIVVAGGAEGAHPLGVVGFNACKALSTDNENYQSASRPFDSNRNGFVIAEGAGVIVMESETSAKNRGAKILAEITGVGASCDAYDEVTPRADARGIELAMQRAMKISNVGPEAIDYVNTHGTSTVVGDVIECQGISRVLGNHKKKVLINSTKSLMGHSLGAAGAIEAVVCVKSILDQKVHVSANIEKVDPLIDLPIALETQSKKLDYVLSNSFGFGGQNCSILFKRYG